MSSKPKSVNVNNLLATIQRKIPDSPEPAPEPIAETTQTVAQPTPRSNASRRAAATAPPKSKGGKPVQFWLHDEDRRLVRELAAWLAGQGVRSTDSLVIRAALRTARTNAEFLEAYRHAAQLDGRLKPQKNDTTQSHEGMW
jgi:hypothetical protein